MPSLFSLGGVASFYLAPPTPGYLAPVPTNGEGIRTCPIPGVRCQNCATNGDEVWVVPGLVCAKCRTPAPDEELSTSSFHDDENVA
ncbi:hypothetical protein C8A01DRAFT_19305 [Parachaetomium inaequale]|uniref:Uncharacterized protein n=1 Tax=Parachaetomium inaequale TaxID=2588326 RepID=A0AAN6P8M9_9PEZI|nr:hypothetical protein C8A01DRAFT_19305 [Parachaetomium inaequale]